MNLFSYFPKDKWESNSKLIVGSKSETLQQEIIKDQYVDTKKVLGIFWNPSAVTLGYKIQIELHPSPTKLQVLSDVARVFDLLGVQAPVVMYLKILFWELWLQNLDWDD